jgi:hypothetical protein
MKFRIPPSSGRPGKSPDTERDRNCCDGGQDSSEDAQAQNGWRIEEVQIVAVENLVEWRRPGRGGSHVIFSAPGVREIVSVPPKRPIKPVYIE